MKLHHSLCSLIAVAVFCGGAMSYAADAPKAAAEKGQEPKVSWVLNFKNDKQGDPRGNLVLSVNGKKTTIIENTIGVFNVIEPEAYKEKKIPAKALAACGGFWAGSGDDFYVANEKGKLNVYQSTYGEEGGRGKYRLVKTIPLP